MQITFITIAAATAALSSIASCTSAFNHKDLLAIQKCKGDAACMMNAAQSMLVKQDPAMAQKLRKVQACGKDTKCLSTLLNKEMNAVERTITKAHPEAAPFITEAKQCQGDMECLLSLLQSLPMDRQTRRQMRQAMTIVQRGMEDSKHCEDATCRQAVMKENIKLLLEKASPAINAFLKKNPKVAHSQEFQMVKGMLNMYLGSTSGSKKNTKKSKLTVEELLKAMKKH